MKYAVVVEQGETSFGAHVPDLPECVAVGLSNFTLKASAKMAFLFQRPRPALNSSKYAPPNNSLDASGGGANCKDEG